MDIRLTYRGRYVALASATAIVLGLALRAVLVLGFGLAAAAAAALDAAYLRLTCCGLAYLEPLEASAELQLGQEAEIYIMLRGRPKGRPVPEGMVRRVEELRPGALRASIIPGHAGRHVIDGLGFRKQSPLGLFVTEWREPVRPPILVSAVPRGVAMAAEIIRSGRAEGQAPAWLFEPREAFPLAMRGEEYAWSVQLPPGELPEVVDWRATARRGSIMVKAFYPESWLSRSLIVDATFTDLESADEVVALALSIAASGSAGGLRIYVYDGERVEELSGAVELARRLLALVGRLYPDALRALDRSPEPRPASLPESGLVVAVSQLLSPLPYMLPPGCVVLQPTRPWARAPSLEEAYMMRVRHDRAAAALRAAGCRVLGPEELRGLLPRPRP